MNSFLCYTVGALLYCPANHPSVSESVIQERFGTKYSLALCLEDTIKDDCVDEAEHQLISSLKAIYQKKQIKRFYIPKIFIRVRYPEQILNLFQRLEQAEELLTGFILPKFALEQADPYIEAISHLNEISGRTIYMMPIFESPSIVHLQNRSHILYTLKEKLDQVSDYVLNIRVGGNDLCHTFGFRRNSTESIHDIRPIANIFSDIITVFGMDYVVSGPVWEYYDGEHWESGLKQELKQDRLCGFLGKTAIHPSQIPIINESYMVSRNDYEDAKAILHWEDHANQLVSASLSHERMNEYKTHYNWAKRILFMAEYYGIT